MLHYCVQSLHFTEIPWGHSPPSPPFSYSSPTWGGGNSPAVAPNVGHMPMWRSGLTQGEHPGRAVASAIGSSSISRWFESSHRHQPSMTASPTHTGNPPPCGTYEWAKVGHGWAYACWKYIRGAVRGHGNLYQEVQQRNVYDVLRLAWLLFLAAHSQPDPAGMQ